MFMFTSFTSIDINDIIQNTFKTAKHLKIKIAVVENTSIFSRKGNTDISYIYISNQRQLVYA